MISENLGKSGQWKKVCPVVILFLMRKLELTGIRNNVLGWFQSCHREQYVLLNGVERSVTKKVQWGVLQGSILDPTLSLAYINSISKLKLYADDKVLLYLDEAYLYIRGDLEMLTKCSHKLTLNQDTSTFMYIAKQNLGYQ